MVQVYLFVRIGKVQEPSNRMHNLFMVYLYQRMLALQNCTILCSVLYSKMRLHKIRLYSNLIWQRRLKPRCITATLSQRQWMPILGIRRDLWIDAYFVCCSRFLGVTRSLRPSISITMMGVPFSSVPSSQVAFHRMPWILT